jgi:IMP dehydrogenase
MSKFFSIEELFTFSDILLVPAYSDFLPESAVIQTRFSKNIKINIPVASAAMDTVTEFKLAIKVAQEGGIGIIHKNMSPAEQADQVRAVKRYESYVIFDPITVLQEASLEEAISLMKRHEISGLPVIDKEGKVAGILTKRDVRFLKSSELSNLVKDFMTPKERLITAKQGATKQGLQDLFKLNKVEKIVIVDEGNKCIGLATVKDIEKIGTADQASRDSKGRLVVGAAVGTSEAEKARVDILVEAGVDVVVVDTAHGHSKGVLDMVKWVKDKYSNTVDVVGGNVVTKEAVKAVAEAGADGVKVGIGPGSICTTRIVAGVGFPQLSAIIACYEEAAKYDIPVIADGGIQSSGDVAKAIAGGASCVMLGSLLAGTDESPGEIVMYQGRAFKMYRGMGSTGAMIKGSSDRYFQSGTDKNKLVPQGVEGKVPYKGSAGNILFQIVGGLRASMGYTGNRTINQMQANCRFVKVSDSTQKESHPHSITIVENPVNYWF